MFSFANVPGGSEDDIPHKALTCPHSILITADLQKKRRQWLTLRLNQGSSFNHGRQYSGYLSGRMMLLAYLASYIV